MGMPNTRKNEAIPTGNCLYCSDHKTTKNGYTEPRLDKRVGSL